MLRFRGFRCLPNKDVEVVPGGHDLEVDGVNGDKDGLVEVGLMTEHIEQRWVGVHMTREAGEAEGGRAIGETEGVRTTGEAEGGWAIGETEGECTIEGGCMTGVVTLLGFVEI